MPCKGVNRSALAGLGTGIVTLGGTCLEEYQGRSTQDFLAGNSWYGAGMETPPYLPKLDPLLTLAMKMPRDTTYNIPKFVL